jgi:hypothetical protein
VAPIGSYQPDTSPAVAEVAALIANLGDVGQLVSAVHAAASELGARLGPGGAAALGADARVLDQITGLLEAGNAVAAAVSELVGAADRGDLASQVTATGLITWLMLKANLTRRQATRLVMAARQAGRFDLIRQAALAGAVNQFQVEAVAGVLGDVARDLDRDQLALAESQLAAAAQDRASDALARSGEEILEQVAPEVAQASAEAKAARQLRRAESRQFFKVSDNGDGTASLRGLLPSTEAERVRSVIDKMADKTRRQQAKAPDGKLVDRAQARASALVELCRHAQSCGNAAPLGAAGARLVITVNAADLARQSAAGPSEAEDQSRARLAVSGERLGQRAFAWLACDSEAMRVVLGAKGQVLDVGRATRIIPAGLRAALTVRDRGCSFPGCDRPPEACEAHYVIPWWRGGPTNLHNLVLLCPSHHRLVEPPRNGPPGWEPKLRDDGRFEFKPPRWFDPARQAILHHRHKTPPTP